MSKPAVRPGRAPATCPQRLPRVGFLGVGWIGRSRMQALAATGAVEAAAVADLDPDVCARAATDVGAAHVMCGLDDLLEIDLDGIVIATPSALHADQAVAALRRGVAVFCQKPLGRTAAETEQVVAMAREADRLLAVDLSYRQVRAMRAARELIAAGELGRVYALDLVFHNAYGPDKAWFTSRELAGGGCLIDLGTHLLDIALWLTGSASARVEAARLLRRGRPVAPDGEEVEDFAIAQLALDGDATARVACSWFLPAGRDCAFECTAYGTDGAVSVVNIGGSFYDFRAARHVGTASQPLADGADAWAGRSIAAWGQALRRSNRFDSRAEELVRLARLVDDVYGWRA